MTLALRPSFALDLPMPSHAAIAQIGAQLEAGAYELRRTRVPGGGPDTTPRDDDHLVLTVPPSERHMWSPWLTIELGPRGDGTHLFGRFSPHPSVWTAFMFGYLALGLVLVFSLIFAGSLAMIGSSPWPLPIAGATALAIGTLWWIARVGQRLAQTQMHALRSDLDRALAACQPAT